MVIRAGDGLRPVLRTHGCELALVLFAALGRVNLVLGCAIQAMSEAFSLVRKYDVQPQVLYDVMTEGLFAAPAYKVYGRIIVEEAYDRAGSTIALNLKDANLIIAAGDIARVPLPSGNTFRDRLLSAIAHGDADKDVAALALEQARACGLAS